MAPSLPPFPARRYRSVGRRHRGRIGVAVVVLGALLVACSGRAGESSLTATVPDPGASTSSPESSTSASSTGATSTDVSSISTSTTGALTASTAPTTASTTPSTIGAGAAGESNGAAVGGARAAPDWLGQRTLPTTAAGRVEVPQTTPAELRDRRLATADRLAPPPSDAFTSSIDSVGDEVLARSTWEPRCPVGRDELAYVTVAFWGFDGRPHTGELLVNGAAAVDLVAVFEQLHRARFPIEEMRIVTRADLEAEPTGDGNNTTAFVCRAVTGGSSFSEHAYGLAVDLNPFHNPYQRDDLILPELAGHYLDRSLAQPGMIADGDPAVQAFAAIGWSWGGDWSSLKDYQHFSHNGR